MINLGFNLDYMHMICLSVVRTLVVSIILKEILKVCLMVDCHSQV